MSEQTQGHPHWQRMIEYGEDSKTDPEAWRGWQFRDFGTLEWQPLIDVPIWNEQAEYRRFPRMCTLGDMEYPEPVKEPLEMGEKYFLVNAVFPKSPPTHKWGGYPHEMRRLSLRLIQRTEQGAIAQGLAMIKAIGGEV